MSENKKYKKQFSLNRKDQCMFTIGKPEFKNNEVAMYLSATLYDRMKKKQDWEGRIVFKLSYIDCSKIVASFIYKQNEDLFHKSDYSNNKTLKINHEDDKVKMTISEQLPNSKYKNIFVYLTNHEIITLKTVLTDSILQLLYFNNAPENSIKINEKLDMLDKKINYLHDLFKDKII